MTLSKPQKHNVPYELRQIQKPPRNFFESMRKNDLLELSYVSTFVFTIPLRWVFTKVQKKNEEAAPFMSSTML